MKKIHLVRSLAATLLCLLTALPAFAGNPIIRDRFTADPAALVHDGKVYLYVGHDEAEPDGDFFVMNEWLIYVSDNLIDWELAGTLPRTEFSWARRPTAWAAQTIERNGKFYWYVTVLNDTPDNPASNGFAIAVAVSDHPAQGFRDALGKPLVRSDMTEAPEHMRAPDLDTWDNIDPTVFVDDDGQAYLYWGNSHLYYAKLKDNMIELDGDIHQLFIQEMPGTFTEAPWIHKHGETYYLTFAMNYPEQIAYATSDSVTGPWTYGGLLLDLLPDTGTSHQAILEFNDEWYFIYHTAALPTGGNFRRSVSIERFEHNPDGSIDQLVATASSLAFNPYRIQVKSGEDHYLRHQNRELRVEPLNRDDTDLSRFDFKWHKVAGLADPSSDHVSFQAENMPGFYLIRSCTGRVKLAKHDGTDEFKELATFKQVRGLAGRNGQSFQAYGQRRLYLVQQPDGELRVDSVKRAERKHATFRLQEVTD